MNRLFVVLGQVKSQLWRSSALKKVALGMIVIGVILRLFQYSLNRSLWLDECFIALNVVNKSFLELLGPLDYFQVAPIGFLFTQKALLLLLGNNEYILRLFPLVAGIVSLFLFYYLARHCIREQGALIAVGLFSLSAHLIYYSSEVKQYSSDVTIALLLLAVTLFIRSKKFTNRFIAFFGAIGAIAVWFSLPSVFVLAGIGCTLSLFSLARKEWSTNKRLFITYFIWLLSFGVFCLMYSRNISTNLDNQQFIWNINFMPFPPASLSDFKWFGETFFLFFKNPLSLPLNGLAALFFLLGTVSIFSRDKQLFFILLSPVFVTLFVSAFHLYPFKGRLLLFLVPSMLLFIGEGVAFLGENTKRYSPVVWIILIGLLFYGPLTTAASHMVTKTGYVIMPGEDTKSVMKYIKGHRIKGDVLYLYFFSKFPFWYYQERYGFSRDDYIEGAYGIDDRNKYLDDLQKLRGNKRVWLMFSQTHKSEGSSDENFFLCHLDSFGTRLDSFKSDGASAYLYDLSK